MSYIPKREYGDAWPRMWKLHQSLLDIDETQLETLFSCALMTVNELYDYEHVLRRTVDLGRIDASDAFVCAITGLLDEEPTAASVIARVARAVVVSDSPDPAVMRVMAPAMKAGLLS